MPERRFQVATVQPASLAGDDPLHGPSMRLGQGAAAHIPLHARLGFRAMLPLASGTVTKELLVIRTGYSVSLALVVLAAMSSAGCSKDPPPATQPQP